MSDYRSEPLDKELYISLEKKALKTLRALCAGNGIKIDSIRLNGFEPQYYTTDCSVIFTIKPDIDENTMHGRHPGEVCGSRQEAQEIINSYIQGLKHDSSFHESLKQSLVSRPDRGLGIKKDEKISMTNYQKSMVWHEECGQCHGKGQTTCHQCNGNKQERCMRCHGTSKIQCVRCGSTGRLRQGNQEVQCHYCRGTGQAPCDLCRNTGKTPCRTCGARGTINCQTCSGSGWFTHIYHAVITAFSRTGFNKDRIPPKLVGLFERSMGKLIETKSLKIENIGQSVGVYDDGSLSISYEIGFPYGDVHFVIKGKPVDAAIFGYNGKIVNLPPILDRLIEPGFKKLENAARQKGDVAKQLKEASRYKIIAMALLQSARYSAKKTAMIIKRKYPMGISDNTLQTIAKMADKATSDISKKPKITGLMMGLAVSALLYGAYLFTPARAMAASHIANPLLHTVLDALLVGMCSYISIFISQMTAKKSMQTALGHLLPAGQRQSLVPKAGNVVYAAIIGCILLFAIACEMTIHVPDAATPAWYADLRGVSTTPAPQ